MNNEQRGHAHIQQTPASTWTIVHGLFTEELTAEVFIDDGGILVKMIPKTVTIVDESTVEITFSDAQGGQALIF